MSTAPDLATRLRAWEDADEPRGFVVVLPLMSANDLWKPVIKRTRAGKQYAAMVMTPAYKAWKKLASDELWLLQRPKPVSGRVAVSVVIVPSTTKQDADNTIKAVLDALVDAELIEGDTVKTVIRIQVDVWPDNAGLPIKPGEMQVRVRGLPEAAE